ncbi:tRNA (adenosine(37)-N6)-threonylcarbamoyltransferase complex ATPase subunit type 1 TsaE [Xenophilus sp. Marseille-Q4582]|uniref:tRNA (adenosine(37)-N6)-threonylcarbamoyltransferase complex ATPase subunit type 1 TsaE n=1 Tax=Xenophilus sp. Marseille-Q4582 TaxID=2866600 RepID=UPI001CE3C94C|nr:tRNA (adenosine(37)-N6)-threonylcarbamoyltransferase complex ATPase subunit type 1 TsaE [Xenophilus sp. Marseille-Q4582]
MSSDNHPSIVETPPVRAQASQHWRDEEDTARLAQALAAAPALRDAFIALHGDLGAGKTTFVRHLLRALGVTGRIKSPTYAVVEPHQGREGQAIFHFDFYRFNDPREWEDAGFRDIFAGAGLKLAEWPANARGQLPVPDLSITIDAMSDDTRHVTLQAHSDSGVRLLQAAA